MSTIKRLKEEHEYWQVLETLLGWRLYGWSQKLTASFTIAGNWNDDALLTITGAERDRLVTRLSDPLSLFVIPFFHIDDSRSSVRIVRGTEDEAIEAARIIRLMYDDEQARPILISGDHNDLEQIKSFLDEAIPTCDICGEAEPEPDADWNGVTGNHVSCEEAIP